MIKILFITPYPKEGASTRFRIEQYIPYLHENGFVCTVRPFIFKNFYKILYIKGLYLKKILYFIKSCANRTLDLLLAIKSDTIFIHLESFPFGPPLFEWLLNTLGKKVIYDFDDAIYLRSASSANWFTKYLKCPWKVGIILHMSRYIITSNKYLYDFARRFNEKVEIIYTSVNTDIFTPVPEAKQKIADIPTIGWIGSPTTTQYLKLLKNVFVRLANKYSFKLKIVGADTIDFGIPGITIENDQWSLAKEVEQFRSLDIGVYPLPTNQWTLGKGGFKAIQYMSVGVPCIASNVGTNRDVIEDGIDGFLVDSEDEWVDKLSMLIEHPELRKSIGAAGRGKIERLYSYQVSAPRILEIFRKVIHVDTPHG